MARRRISLFSLSFLDAMTCGFGAVILFYMVINANVRVRAQNVTADLRGEVDLVEEQILDEYNDLVEVRNSLSETEEQSVRASGLSVRVLQELEKIRAELATYEDTTLAREEHLNRLKTDLKSLDEEARRLSAASPSEEVPGDRLRAHIGDGDRQYLSGLKVGGQRILMLVDASASMLDETLVNIIRRRNLPDKTKLQAEKWQQAVSTVNWLTAQIPRSSRFQIYVFNDRATSVVAGTDGEWLDGGDREVLESAIQALRQIVPARGTNLYRAFESLDAMQPPPDNLILLVDGLPTQGKSPSRRGTISGRQRLKLFRSALKQLQGRMPINVILFPMEGDPQAASAYWKLAVASGGSFLSPPEDWP